MKNLFLIQLIFLLIFLFGCETVQKKSEDIVKKENEKLSKFIQQPESELLIVMGEPDKISYDDKGSKFFVYTKKKYSITCERKFEIDQSKMVIGVSSRGCF